MEYHLPNGVHAVPSDQLDLRPDSEIDKILTNPPPVRDDKNVWFFWHSGFPNMHHYTQRNVRAWHRRLSKHGWIIRVIDRSPSSPLNVANFLDVTDPATFPQAFISGAIGGHHAPQHTSDLVRWPLLLKYGGVYADVGFLQLGDLDRLWNETIANPESPYEVLSYLMGGADDRALTNYFMCSKRDNTFFARCHQLLLAIWAEEGGRVDTNGSHRSALLKGVPLLAEDDEMSFTENGKTYGPQEVREMLSDYIIQSQAMTMVMGLIDEETGWNGPAYVEKHVYAIDYIEGSQLINVFTSWDGPRAFELMSLPLPKEGEEESADQKAAREIVEGCLSRSFGFKLATGLILRVMGPTLGSLWRDNTDADNVPGTYAHWLWYGVTYWTQDKLPEKMKLAAREPFKRGALLRES